MDRKTEIKQVKSLTSPTQEEMCNIHNCTVYIVTRCEEHSDIVEKAFFDESKAQEYCDKFKGKENEYARHITKINITL